MVATVPGNSLARQTVPLYRLLHPWLRRRVSDVEKIVNEMDEPRPHPGVEVNLLGREAEVPHPGPRGGGR